MFFLLFSVISLLSQHQVFSSVALVWSNSPLPQSAVSLSATSPYDIISNYICKLSNEQVQIRLYVVNELTNEDIQRGSQRKHPILLDAMDEQSLFRYFPNVAGDASKIFALIPQSNDMACAHIHFQITSSNVYQTLHDALSAMKASVNSIGTNTNTAIVMALTSGSGPPRNLNRYSRELAATEKDVIMSEDKTCMFYADKLYWGNVNEEDPSSGNYTLDMNESTCETNENATSAVLQLSWSNGTSDTVKITLMANITGRYWYLESAVINESEYRYFAYGMHSRMDTPPTYSYVCTTAIFIKYNSSTRYGTYDFEDKFYITNFQFQPFSANSTNATIAFGQPNYCTSFFTSGIWMGITSSLLCLGILLFGVHRMMSIKSNDRFDDPKGKPLIIKAQE